MKRTDARFILWLILLLVVLRVQASSVAQSDCEEVLAEANAAYKAKDQEVLLSLLSKANGDVCESNISLLVARDLTRQGFYDSARSFLDDVIRNAEQKRDSLLLGDARYWLGRNLRSDRIYDQSLNAFLLSLEVFDSLRFPDKYARSLNAMANLYDDQGDTEKALTYRRAYVRLLENREDPRKLTIAYINLASTMVKMDESESKEIFRRALDYPGTNAYDDLKAVIHQNLGVLYSEKIKDYDSALYHYQEARILYGQLGQSVLDLDINIAAVKEYQGDLVGALSRYATVLEEVEAAQDPAYRQLLYANLAGVNEKLGRYKAAYKYEKLRAEMSKLLLSEEKNKAIVEAETRYKTIEQEKTILSLEKDKSEAEHKRQRASTLAWIIGLSLLPIALIALLLIRNYKTARLVAEQQSLLDKQRAVELVRQQELIGFDAMVLGQNTERKRLAEALHDHLGSLMATLKLRFESFWLKSGHVNDIDQAIYKRMVTQIDEACDEVRRVSHDTRSGILMSEGLLPAIEELATNINDSGNITIEVSGYGLDAGLEGTIELAVYRIIQELLTNIIKHADTAAAYVQLTMHEGSLNILVEDEGKGFDQNESKDGVGLRSIRSRINYLKGDMAIDSHIARGTTVNLNIPLNL